MGRRGGHGAARGNKRPRTLARDFRDGPRQDVWQPGSGSERHRAGGHAPPQGEQPGGGNGGDWTITAEDMSNEGFEAYYKAQKIMPESEWEAFMKCLRSPLPATFRIAGTGKHAAAVLATLRADFVNVIASSAGSGEGEEAPVQPPVPLPWYPGELAWQMNYSRTQLRRLPALARLHEWLVQGNLYGSIVRQEAVSMVPPLFLDVQPHQVVLDMCAAPGSKTSQLLEALHTSSSDGGVPGALPPGCVIANDADLARCNMLTHQLKRSASPALVVINHDAARLPAPRNVASGQQLRFDRVLADVPCTGDGTLRKAPDLWRKWHVHMGIGIHNLQVSIARRGAALLQTSGRMVYSTCSMNPLEDEAVVAALLRASEGALRLVDTTGQLPELRRSPGMSTWLVMDKSGVRELDAGLVGSARTLARSMFPPSSEEADAMHLYRCMRFLPHHGDTGGFFVAVIEKVSDWPPPPAHTAAHPSSEPKADAGAAEDGDGEDEPAGGGDVQQPTPQEQHRPDGAGSSRQRTAQRTAIDPVNVVTDDWILNTLQSFYGFGPNFPLRGTLYMRMGDFDTLDGAAATGAQAPKPKRLYAVSPGAASLLASDEKRRLKVMSAGVKLFEKGHDAVSKATCPYRITQEGLHWVLPHLGKQLARVNVNQLARLVRRRVLFFETPRNGGDSAGAAGAPMMDADSITALLALTQGCVVLVPLLGSSSEAEADDLAVVAWKGAISVAVMVNKQESPILQARLDKFLDPGELDRQKAEAAAHKSKVIHRR